MGSTGKISGNLLQLFTADLVVKHPSTEALFFRANSSFGQFTSGLLLNDGAQGSPAYTFTDDADTGIYRPNTNRVAITAGNETVMQFTGAADLGIRSTAIAAVTTGSAANVFISDPAGALARSTSSLKYKLDWEFVDPANVELPDPITWTDESGQKRLGFGAEHMHEALPESYEDENYDLRSVVAVLAAKVKRLEAQQHCTCKQG
jgi:hypothetical protein